MRQGLLWNTAGFVTISALLISLSWSIYYMASTQGEGLPLYALISCIMDIGGMAVCVVLFLTTLYDHRTDVTTVYFMAMVILEGFILFWDCSFWFVDGDPGLSKINKIVNYYLLGFILILMAAFWMYIREFIHDQEKSISRIHAAVMIVLALGMLLILTNPFDGILFTVDSEGRYIRGDFYFMTFAGPAITLAIFIYVILKYVDGRRTKYTLCSYPVFPVVASIIQALFYGSGLIYIALLFSIVLIYCNLYMERGRDILDKQTEITEHNITLLAAQIQPYFLYQSLESIAKIEGTPEETKKAIMDFSKYFEVNLQSFSETEPIEFEKELEHVMTYVNLERLRFKDRLNIEFELEDTDFCLPALTLQMLVENAIKHGITTKENGGTVMIKTMESTKEHKILVMDDGVGFDPTAPKSDDGRSHVGLGNVRQRLADMVGGTLTLNSTIGIGTTAEVIIPKTPKM